MKKVLKPRALVMLCSDCVFCLQNMMDHKALPQECCESPVNVLATLDQSKGEDQEKTCQGKNQ